MSERPDEPTLMPPGAIRGLIEGFYGPPWSWAARTELMAWCHQRGMTHYLYAPKDDPFHRERWRDPYRAPELAAFEDLAAQGTLEIGFALSPGLSIDYGSTDDRRALATKIDSLVERGVRLVALLLDDIPVRPGLGAEHASLTAWLWEHLADRADLVLVPTEYTGTRPTPYLDALASGVPADVPIGWTGTTVVCDRITEAEALARAVALGGRRPFLWDNYPVNDAIMEDRLFLGPLRGREPGLLAACSGYAANPMVQPMASKPALASIAGYLSGRDPETAWAEDIGELRVFAEACDGSHPSHLVAAVVGGPSAPSAAAALDELEGWLVAAKDCEAPGLIGEAEPWLVQTHLEARVGLAALNLLRDLAEPGDRPDLGEHAMALAYRWLPLRRAVVSVMGPRGSLRPVMGQSDRGAWTYRSGALAEGQNAIDTLVRHALGLADQSG